VVQVYAIKPTLKPPGTKRLKLEYDVLFSNFAFKFNLRRYNKAAYEWKTESTDAAADAAAADAAADAAAHAADPQMKDPDADIAN